MPLLPAFLTRLIDKSCQSACRAARFPRVNEHTPAHRRSAWATRGLASHTELPKMVGTIPTYIVYDKAEGASHFRAPGKRGWPFSTLSFRPQIWPCGSRSRGLT